MTPTHGQVLAAIDKARSRMPNVLGITHCDDLRATAERHAPAEDYPPETDGMCRVCPDDWPCPDYQQVIDRLTGWGVL